MTMVLLMQPAGVMAASLVEGWMKFEMILLGMRIAIQQSNAQTADVRWLLTGAVEWLQGHPIHGRVEERFWAKDLPVSWRLKLLCKLDLVPDCQMLD